MIRATICEIIKDNQILLQYKAPGRFGEGKWNGPGGKLKLDETPIDGVIREVKEETGLTILDPKEMGCIDFYFGERPEPNWVAYIFRVTEFTGELTPNDEGELRWFTVEEIFNMHEKIVPSDLHMIKDIIIENKGYVFKSVMERIRDNYIQSAFEPI